MLFDFQFWDGKQHSVSSLAGVLRVGPEPKFAKLFFLILIIYMKKLTNSD